MRSTCVGLLKPVEVTLKESVAETLTYASWAVRVTPFKVAEAVEAGKEVTKHRERQ